MPKRVARHHVYVIELDPAVLQHAKGVEEVAPGRKEMAKTSAGLLMFRLRNGEPEVLLGHPGGPFWASKDEGAWSIPKGEFAAGEEPLAAAQREFEEETGCRAQGPFIPLTPITQRGGKVVYAWAVEGDCDPAPLHSNLFSLEWPPKSGKHQQFPEVDRAEWFSVPVARRKIIPAQRGFVTELATLRGKRADPR